MFEKKIVTNCPNEFIDAFIHTSFFRAYKKMTIQIQYYFAQNFIIIVYKVNWANM